MLQKVKPTWAKLNKIFQNKINFYGKAVLSWNGVLLATKEGKILQQLTINTGKLTDTVYNVAPLVDIAIHITSGHKVF